jgi:membrane associated rhomboid family serine protease
MLIIPLKANLSLLKTPVITYSVMLLCVLLYLAQWDREYQIWDSAGAFCAQEVTQHDPKTVHGVFLSSEYGCATVLSILHEQPSKGWLNAPLAEEFVEYYPEYDQEEVEFVLVELYQRFADQAPASLDALIMYDPKAPNPLRMVTKSLAHADFWHLLGNLIFFFAFAGSVEIALGSRRQYLWVLFALSVITSLTYTLTMIGSPYRTPSLGLSGVVMGMIGLFAYLMPWARIRSFVWFFMYMNIMLIPAWVLAAWFIGWDIWNAMRLEYSGVNYAAHIGGGIGGYLIGRYFFRTRKEEIAPLVADEIEHRRAERADVLGILDSARVSTDRTEIQAWHREQALALDRLLERVHGLVTTGQPSAATAKLVDELHSLGDNLERQGIVMERMFRWPPNRTTLDFARIYTHRLMTLGKRHEALMVCEKALEHSPMFRLADPFEAVALAEFARSCDRQDLALALVRDYEHRYDGQGDPVSAGFLEARLLWEHELDREAARARLGPLLAARDHVQHPEIVRFASQLSRQAAT